MILRWHPASVVIGAGMSAAMHVGKLPPAIPLLKEEMGLTLLQAGFMLSTVQGAGMLLGLVVGLGADRWGLRKCMLMGLAFMFFASALGGLSQDATMLLAMRAVEGLGFLLVVTPAPALIRHLVPAAELSKRMGSWGTYMPVGSATAIFLGPVAMALLGWQGWWWVLAGVSVFTWWAVWGCVPKPAAKPIAAPPSPQWGQAAVGKAWPDWVQRIQSVLSARGPWLIAFGFAMYAGQWLAVVGFLPTIYSQSGMAWGLTGVLTAAVALINAVGNWGSGRLLARGWSERQTLSTGFAAMGLGAVLTYVQLDGWELPFALRFGAVLVYSAVGGLIPGTLFACAVRLAPAPDQVGATVGWMQQWSALGQFVGPPSVALMAGWVGGWQWTWVVTLSLSCAGLWLAALIQVALQQKAGRDAT